MKKLTALLLAIFLPLSAAAEAYSFSVSFSADETRFPQYLQEAMRMTQKDIGEEDSELVIRLMQCLLNGLSFDVHVQEQLLSVVCSMSGKPLFDMSIVSDEHTAFMTSSLFQGYAFVSENASQNDAASLNAALEDAAWSAAADEAKRVAAQWYADLEQDVETGMFSGDAYEGGAVCRTWVLSDKDIAELFSALMTENVRAVMNEIARAMAEDDLLRRFDALNAEVAEANAHLYILRAVENEANEVCGLSLTILRDMQQIATASLGQTEKGVKLVVGLGMSNGNYWWEFTANQQQRQSTTSLSGVSREWQADKKMDFSYVSAKVAPVSQLDWQCDVTKSGMRYLWNASICENQNQAGHRYILSSDGKANTNNGEIDFTISIGDAASELASMKVGLCAVEPQTITQDGLETIDISDGFNTQEHEELIEKASALLMARILKVLPADLFVKLLQMNPGQ